MNKETKNKKSQLTKEELLIKFRSSLEALEMKNRMGQLTETHQIKQLKKEIARLLTKITKK